MTLTLSPSNGGSPDKIATRDRASDGLQTLFRTETKTMLYLLFDPRSYCIAVECADHYSNWRPDGRYTIPFVKHIPIIRLRVKIHVVGTTALYFLSPEITMKGNRNLYFLHEKWSFINNVNMCSISLHDSVVVSLSNSIWQSIKIKCLTGQVTAKILIPSVIYMWNKVVEKYSPFDVTNHLMLIEAIMHVCYADISIDSC